MLHARAIFLSLAMAGCLCTAYPQSKTTDTLLAHFVDPPDAAKPRVWWHWMNGNITKAGIYKDLLWMKKSGIGGFQNFDAALATPQVVEKRLTYMTPEWKDAFRFTAKTADSLHLEMAIAGSPGWSESGGPWVLPKDGMKKIVWSETYITGGKEFNGSLPKPPSNSGTFQNLTIPVSVGLSAPTASPPTFYRDINVIAYKVPPADMLMSDLKPKVTASSGSFSLQQLTDGDLETATLLPSGEEKDFAWLQFEFEKPQVIKALTLVGGGDKGPFGLYGELKDTRWLDVSDDGLTFKRVSFIPAGGILQQTVAFPAATGRFFRIGFKNPPPRPDFGALMGTGGAPPKAPAGTTIAELVLHTVTRINRFEEKAAFATAADLYGQVTPASQDVIASTDIIDVTDKMNEAGTFNWTPPAGNWNVIRFGYSLNGKQNHPASPEATGLEVDKLDAAAVKAYFENYLNQYKDATGGLMGAKGGLQYMVTDSWESGVQNWTENLAQEFFKRRGYDFLKWMPALTGHIVSSTDDSERFLWDFRKTLGELVVENHYDQLTTILAKYGMKRYSESHESGRALIADGMEVKRSAAVPMAAMWTPGRVGGDGTGYKSDIRESASVAHLYGQNLVAAESLTAIGNAWSYSPEKLKPTADLELANGLNRFVIHTSVHQPSDEKIPGLGLGPFGQWFTRHETWADHAKAWTTYLARSCYMLQQGKFVADIIYYYGEDNNITSLFGMKLPSIPAGYNYDYVNADALLNLLEVKEGRIVTPAGMSYRLLALDSNSTHMTLKVLKKLQSLLLSGAVITGPKPTRSPSLGDDPEAFKTIVEALWKSRDKRIVVGKGILYTGISIEDALADMRVLPDFTYRESGDKAPLLFVHRKTADKDFYWINNRDNIARDIESFYRITGRSVEIWHPETGRVEPASFKFAGGVTTVPIRLEPNDAVFVVFGQNTTATERNVIRPTETKLMTLTPGWNLTFSKGPGAPAPVALDKLVSWTEITAPGVKYFSGEGQYAKTIVAPANWFDKSARLWMELGEVKDIAEVIVNGKPAGLVWKKPFRVELTNLMKPGTNSIVVKVTNLWVNRLIGDQQAGPEKKYTYTTMAFYNAGSPLLPSGLMGPVDIFSVQ